MDFFKAQDAARRRTWQLGLLFAAAVFTLVVLTNLLIAATFFLSGSQVAVTDTESSLTLLSAMPTELWGWISFGVIGIVGVATLYKYLRLRGGGRVVAESFGGRLLTREQADFKETRLLNVVEEMAIASGTPVPPVYLLDEPGINAFAAGHSIEDAVVGVNRGALDTLSREELQGVIAHEFSHILNGDMKLNLRLIAILHGILFIGLIGRVIARQSGNSRKNGLAGVAFGVGLIAIGYGGTFFGNMIKAAVSRQREFLADASAVQFTRNPEGISGALEKIGGFLPGSTVNNSQAHEASHLFFDQVGVRKFFSGLFATHPPLEVRIRSIEPRWDGKFPATAPLPDRMFETFENAGISSMAPRAAPSSAAKEGIVEAVGNPDAKDLARAQMMVKLAGKALTQATQEGFSATALMYAMLLSHHDTIRKQQLNAMASTAGARIADETVRLYDLIKTVEPDQKTVLLAMSIPALKTQSAMQYRAFQQQVAALVNRDTRIDLFEWLTCVTLMKDLTPHFTGVPSQGAGHTQIKAVELELLNVLASLASTAEAEPTARRDLVERSIAALGLKLPSRPLPEPDFATINASLTKLRARAPLQKPRVLKAIVAALGAKDGINPMENALIHLLAGALDCPVPVQFAGGTATNA